MKTELLELLNAVKKGAATAHGGEAEVGRCLDALCKLKSFPVTAEILISIKIGKHIGPLREHPYKAVRDLASELVANWTKIILQRASKDKKDAILNVADADHRDKVALKTASNAVGGDALRVKVRQHLVEALSKVSSEAKADIKDKVSGCDPNQIAESLESALFEAWGNCNGKQKAKYRSLLFNIKDPKNPDFRRKVLLGEVGLQAVSKLSAKEMASDELQQKIHEMEAKALMKRIIGIANKGTTDQFKCGRCGKRDATYFQLQTRSADEPMTTHVTCVACNHHWKF